mmetsp:Transcript_8648/g.20833  ORF Transcript_8648/g.20833 Transcript_8648/m.20833 type:complete len:296 (+) Transcript_8648:1114-2001(+)
MLSFFFRDGIEGSFVAAFPSSVDAASFSARFPADLNEVFSCGTGSAECAESSASVAPVLESYTSRVELLVCMDGSTDEFIREVRHEVNPMGTPDNLADIVKLLYTSVRTPFTMDDLISNETLAAVPPACVDEAKMFCCANPFVWSIVATFGDEMDARGFVHFAAADLSMHLNARRSLGATVVDFVAPRRKGKLFCGGDLCHGEAKGGRGFGIVEFFVISVSGVLAWRKSCDTDELPEMAIIADANAALEDVDGLYKSRTNLETIEAPWAAYEDSKLEEVFGRRVSLGAATARRRR